MAPIKSEYEIPFLSSSLRLSKLIWFWAMRKKEKLKVNRKMTSTIMNGMMSMMICYVILINGAMLSTSVKNYWDFPKRSI